MKFSRKSTRLSEFGGELLKKIFLSFRNFNSAIRYWKLNGYQYPLDYYILDNIIKPAEILEPKEAAQLFYLFKFKGFLNGENFDNIEMDAGLWGIKEVPQIVKVNLVGKIKELVGRVDFETNNGQISKIIIKGSSAENSQLNKAVSPVKYFNNLQWFYCSNNPAPGSLPELPDGLQILFYTSTPAAANPKTIRQLKKFKQKHPRVIIEEVLINQ